MPSAGQAYQRTEKLGFWATLDHNTCNAARLIQLPRMEWLFEDNDSIGNYIIAASPSGGPIAVCRRDSADVAVYSSIGSSIASHAEDLTSEVVHLSWNTELDHLIVACKDGTLHFLDVNLHPVATSLRIDSPTYFCPSGNGIICTTKTGNAIAVECIAIGSGEYRPKSVVVEQLTDAPACCLALSCDASDSGFEELLIAPHALGDSCATVLKHVIFATPPKCVDLKVQITGGSILQMAVSSLGKQRVAALISDGSLWCGHVDLGDVVRIGEIDFMQLTGAEEPDIGELAKTTRLLWCGDDCVAVAQWHNPHLDEDSKVTLIDPVTRESDYFSGIPEEFYCIQECDGFRIVSLARQLFVQRVSEPAYRAFYQPTSPAAQLIASYDQYMEDDPSSVTAIRSLSGSQERLIQAIEGCIHCAGFEVQVDRQQRFLRIAAYGKGFTRTFEADEFVMMCRRLRVLQAISGSGMHLTFEQFRLLTAARLTERLLQQGFYELAHAVCRCLDHPQNDVLLAWAKQKILSAAPPRELAPAIIEKVHTCKGLSLSSVAEAAHHQRKDDLALLLLEAEPYPESQIPVLLRMQYDDIALAKAVESGNTDLVFSVIIQLIAQRGAAAANAIMRSPVAKDILLSYAINCKTQSQHGVVEQYNKDHPAYEAYVSLLQYLREEERIKRNFIDSRNHDGWDIYQEFKGSAAQTAELLLTKDEDGKISVKYLRLQQHLLTEQIEYTRKTKKLQFLNASVATTIRLLMESGLHDKAEALAKKFSLNEKMFWWIKLSAFINIRDWESIDKLGGGGAYRTTRVKSPIGFDPFVVELLRAGQRQRAAGFIFRVPNLMERLEFYVQCEEWTAAAKDCIAEGEQGFLLQLQERARGNTQALEAIEKVQRRSGK